uniref:Uncharacterized protein n=1 Tax=Timema bartmani TaxID=61472 RepID=A0A7R9FCW6_9NEOP|nr:unnamed protein product [Timema bartmani]
MGWRCGGNGGHSCKTSMSEVAAAFKSACSTLAGTSLLEFIDSSAFNDVTSEKKHNGIILSKMGLTHLAAD